MLKSVINVNYFAQNRTPNNEEDIATPSEAPFVRSGLRLNWTLKNDSKK